VASLLYPPYNLMNKIVIIGRIGSPHGIRGWSKLFSYTHPAENITNYQQWFLQIENNLWQPIAMKGLNIEANKGGLMRVQFEGCDSPEVARTYTNALIGVSRDELPALSLGDYYWSDLEGLNVVNHQGVTFGQVSHLFSTGANDVLVVKGERE